MVHLDGIEKRIGGGVRERAAGEDGGSRYAALCGGERLDVETAGECLAGAAVLVGYEIALIPCDAELRLGNLDDKQVEIRVGRQTVRGDLHVVNGASRIDLHRGGRVRQAGLRSGRYDHAEGIRVVTRRRCERIDCQCQAQGASRGEVLQLLDHSYLLFKVMEGIALQLDMRRTGVDILWPLVKGL